MDTSTPSTATTYQANQYSVQNLTPTLHRLTIEVLHQRDATTQGSWIWVDAFDVQNGSLVAGPVYALAGQGEETTVYANYSGHNGAVDPGSRVDFSFNGTAVTWLGYEDPYSGTAQVYIDASLQTTVDTHSSTSQAQTSTWSVSG